MFIRKLCSLLLQLTSPSKNETKFWNEHYLFALFVSKVSIIRHLRYRIYDVTVTSWRRKKTLAVIWRPFPAVYVRQQQSMASQDQWMKLRATTMFFVQQQSMTSQNQQNEAKGHNHVQQQSWPHRTNKLKLKATTMFFVLCSTTIYDLAEPTKWS